MEPTCVVGSRQLLLVPTTGGASGLARVSPCATRNGEPFRFSTGRMQSTWHSAENSQSSRAFQPSDAHPTAESPQLPLTEYTPLVSLRRHGRIQRFLADQESGPSTPLCRRHCSELQERQAGTRDQTRPGIKHGSGQDEASETPAGYPAFSIASFLIGHRPY